MYSTTERRHTFSLELPTCSFSCLLSYGITPNEIFFWGADIYFRSRNTFQGLLKVNCNTCEACKPSLPSLVIHTHFLEKQDMMACWVLEENHSNEHIHPQHVCNHFLPNIAQPNPALGPAHPQPSPAARLSGETRKRVWWLSTVSGTVPVFLGQHHFLLT